MIFKRKRLIYILTGISISASVVFIIFNNYYFIYTINGKSMEPEFKELDRIFIRKTNGNYSFNRFDIIIFNKNSDNKSLSIKRIIGTPEETIEIRQNVIFINGKKLNEPFLKKIDKREIIKDPKNLNLIKIPKNSFYLIGDNRELSKDSRNYGVIEKERIIGKVLFTYWTYGGNIE